MNSYLGKGFTFIELLYVVAIIGILAAIALPAYNDYIVRAKLVEALIMPVEIKSSINDYYQSTGRLPTNNEQAGIAPSDAYRGNFVEAIEVENGAIHIRLDSKAIGIVKKGETQWITLRPQTNDKYFAMDLIWICNDEPALSGVTIEGKYRTNVAAKYLPANCR